MRIRELRKRERRRRMLDAAKRLWKKKGYDKVSIESIARAAAVSDRTVYNYFASKPGILSNLILEEIEELLVQGESVIEKPPKKAVDGVIALLGQYDAILEHHNKKMWREFLGGAMSEPLDVGYWVGGVESRLCDQLARLLTHYKQSKQVHPSTDVNEAAEALRNAYMCRVLAYTLDRTASLSVTAKSFLRQVRLIFSGLESA